MCPSRKWDRRVERRRGRVREDVSEMAVRDATSGARVAQRGTPTVAQLGLAAALALAAVGCRGGGAAVDATQEAGADAAGCAGPTMCDGTAVRACVAGARGDVLEQCGPTRACSLGRCTAPACATAEQTSVSALGCTFYTFDLDNVTSDDPLPT